jgi:hypothetical protein
MCLGRIADSFTRMHSTTTTLLLLLLLCLRQIGLQEKLKRCKWILVVLATSPMVVGGLMHMTDGYVPTLGDDENFGVFCVVCIYSFYFLDITVIHSLWKPIWQPTSWCKNSVRSLSLRIIVLGEGEMLLRFIAMYKKDESV